jgi:hypothetical protein
MITRNCDECQRPYEAEPRYLNRGQGLFCSKECSANFNGRKRVIVKIPNTTCAYCEIKFYLSPSKLKISKSGLHFCCRAHKDQAQRIGGIEAIMPPHYGTSNSPVPPYRDKAFRELPNYCAVCGWNDYLSVLEVNHKDLDRSNNDISNLEILCPTHHQVFHYLDGSGKWSKKSKV